MKLISIALSCIPALMWSAAGPGGWISMNADVLSIEAPEMYTYEIDALAFSDKMAYAGGQFVMSGRQRNLEHVVMVDNHWIGVGVAAWDGARWSMLGAPMQCSESCEGLISTLLHTADGMLYVGGEFSQIGSEPFFGVARWDGESWQPLGSGIRGQVYALAADDSGKLYAGGRFRSAGGRTVNNIAQWDGKQWSPLGQGADGLVYSLATDAKGNLYAGGDFIRAGGIEVHRVAKWDGARWSALGSGIRDRAAGDQGTAARSSGARDLMPDVRALVTDAEGNLFAGGNFLWAGDIEVRHVAKWNGTRWSSLGNDRLDAGQHVLIHEMQIDSEGNLYVAGRFDDISGDMQDDMTIKNDVGNLARWNGETWFMFERAAPYAILTLALDRQNAPYLDFYSDGDWTGGMRKWDGERWVTAFEVSRTSPDADQGINGAVGAVLIDPMDNLYIGGGFTSVRGIACNRIAKRERQGWTALGGGFSHGDRDGGISGLVYDEWGQLYAIYGFALGARYYLDGTGTPRSANALSRWDGVAWHAMLTDQWEMNAMVLGLNSDLYLGRGNRISSWNGARWSSIEGDFDGDVLVLAIDNAGHLYAGGEFKNVNDLEVNHIAKWDGQEWSALGRGMGGGSISGITATDGSRTLVTNTLVSAMAFDSKGRLYAGGDFHTADGNVVSNIAVWDGAWRRLGQGLSLPFQGHYGPGFRTPLIRAIVIDDSDNLFVGGQFTHADGIEVNNIARWDGRRWSALRDGGVTGADTTQVSSLAFDSAGDLYVGGNFTYAGNVLSPYLAKYRFHPANNDGHNRNQDEP